MNTQENRNSCKKWRDSHQEHEKARRRKWWVEHPEKRKEYNELKNNQDNRCAICNVEFGDTHQTKACVDHDHNCCRSARSCGKCIRSLLCGFCNSGLGFFRDDPVILANAVEYVTKCRKVG